MLSSILSAVNVEQATEELFAAIQMESLMPDARVMLNTHTVVASPPLLVQLTTL